VLFGLAAAIGLGIVVAVSSRVFRSGDSRPVTLYLSTVAAIVLIAFCAGQGDIALPDTPGGWTGFVAAMLFYAFAVIAFFIAVSMIGPARTSLLSYVEPIVSAGLGVVLLGEALTLTQIGGIILMVDALAGATMLKQRAG
jgi:drug/metabolite transporter (DMT)-like permease